MEGVSLKIGYKNGVVNKKLIYRDNKIRPFKFETCLKR